MSGGYGDEPSMASANHRDMIGATFYSFRVSRSPDRYVANDALEIATRWNHGSRSF
jgi:hypothetical protein